MDPITFIIALGLGFVGAKKFAAPTKKWTIRDEMMAFPDHFPNFFVYGNGPFDPKIATEIMEGRGGNMLYVASDCSYILEGPYFEPLSSNWFPVSGEDFNAEEFDNLNDTLTKSVYGDKNSVYGYIDHLMKKGYTRSIDIANKILDEAFDKASPLRERCDNDVTREWINDFAYDIGPYVEENGGIGWDPG